MPQIDRTNMSTKSKSRPVREDGIGDKAVLLSAELTDLQALRRWGYRGILHRPWCARVQHAFARLCDCEP